MTMKNFIFLKNYILIKNCNILLNCDKIYKIAVDLYWKNLFLSLLNVLMKNIKLTKILKFDNKMKFFYKIYNYLFKWKC